MTQQPTQDDPPGNEYAARAARLAERERHERIRERWAKAGKHRPTWWERQHAAKGEDRE